MKLEEYLKDNPKEYLVFDFDHTIVDLILPWTKLMNQLKLLEKNVDKNFTAKIKKVNDLSLLANKIVKRYGPASWIFVAKLWTEFEKRNLKGFNPNLDIVNFIKANKDNYKFYIWTSNTMPTVEKILTELEIRDVFQKIVTRDEVTYIKPNRVGFEQIYEPDKDKSKYLMIGDSKLNDGEAAKNAQIDFLQVG